MFDDLEFTVNRSHDMIIDQKKWDVARKKNYEIQTLNHFAREKNMLNFINRVKELHCRVRFMLIDISGGVIKIDIIFNDICK